MQPQASDSTASKDTDSQFVSLRLESSLTKAIDKVQADEHRSTRSDAIRALLWEAIKARGIEAA